MNKKITKIILIVMLIILLILNYSKNILSENDNITDVPIFEGFQADSEYIVFSEMYQDKFFQDNNKYGLATVVDAEGNRVDNIWGLVKQNHNENENLKIEDYTSQLGLQGHIFSFLYNKLKIPFEVMKLMCCTALAIVVIAICYCIYHKYGSLMATIFYLTFLLSPWVVSFAKHLYWVEFTWFLPMLLGLILSINYKKKKILIPGIFISILVKCLCGYEYISTIMIGTVSFFIVDFFVDKDKEKRKEIFKTTFIVGITCILAFATALVIHATIRGNGNIIEGIKDVYKNDVLRRTIISTDKENYTGALKESMDATVPETIAKYFSWDSDIILGIEGEYFKLIFVSTIGILIYNAIRKKEDCLQNIIMFLVFLSSTLSWLILGKSHSYIHTHMNYVLWYFGYVQICLYIIIKFISEQIYYIGSGIEKRKGDEKL